MTFNLSEVLAVKSLREFDLGTHISLKNKYIYLQVSKVASSTIKHYLQTLEVRGTGRRVEDVNNRNLSPHIWPSQLNEDHLREIFDDPSFKKIAFVRSPFSRTLSCYLHRICGAPKSPSNRALARATGGLCGPDISFAEFVDVVCSQTSKEQDSHWRSQYDEIIYSQIGKWGQIGKFENLTSDLQSVLSQFKPVIEVEPKLTLSPAVTSADDRLHEFYTPVLVEKIATRFALDFDTFGYSRKIG